MRISKVYTRTGDAGKTRLVGGQEVWKDSLRVDAYGTIDELNSLLGLARAINTQTNGESDAALILETSLKWIQNKLFDLGAILATAPGQSFVKMSNVTADDVARLERVIDDCQRDLEPLKEFILPGGGQLSALLHVSRTVCRRAERLVVSLSKVEPVKADVLKFLNRLSDTLFVLARWVGKQQAEPEFLWERTE